MADGEITPPSGYTLEKQTTLPPGYNLETAAAPSKKPATFWGNVKALFNPPEGLPRGNEFSEGAGAHTLPGTTIPTRETMNSAAQLAGPLVGMGDSAMGMPRVNLASIGVPENLGSKLLGGARNFVNPKTAPETIPAQSLTESPNYPQILAGRALARQQARAVLMPKNLPKPEPSMLAGTLTSAPSSFTGELPPAPTELPKPPATIEKSITPRSSLRNTVLRVPEPTGGDPRWMASIKRPGLLPAALQGHEGAAEQLRNLGATVLYEPRGGVGYPGPRLGPQSPSTEEAPAIVRPSPNRPLGSSRLTPPEEQPAIRIAPTPRSESLKTYYGITQDMRDYLDSQALEIQKMPEALRTARMEELKAYGGKGTMLKERLAMEAAKDSGTQVSATPTPVSSQNQIRILENQERALLDQSSRARTWTKANELTRHAQRISEKIKALRGSTAGFAAD